MKSLLTAGALCAFAASAAFGANATVTLTKDVAAKERFPTTNYGADTILQTSAQTGYSKIIFLQFNVSGIPAGATGISAELRLRSTSTTSAAITAHAVSSTTWSETGLTWSNKPALGTQLGSADSSHTSGADSVWNVSSHVNGNGTFALGLNTTFSGDTTFSSREGANAPVLIVTYNPPSSYNIYRGSTHAHSNYSHDTAATNTDPAGLYAIAVNEEYDFFAVTDHTQSPAFQPVSATNAAWVDSKNDALNATTSAFVGIAGFEHSENNAGAPNPQPGTGHITVLNTNAYLNAESTNVDLPYLYNWLKTAAPAVSGTPVVAGFNHPGTTSFNSFAYRDAAITDIVTFCEVINSDNNVHETGWRAALNAGWKVSPTSGGDQHASCCGIQNDTSRVFVLATAKTRAAILDAFKNRRTYAALHDKNIQVSYTCNGAIMGSTLAQPSSFNFVITVSDDAAFQDIQILGSANTTPVATTTVNAASKTWNVTVNDTTSKYFYIRITRAGSPMVWTAPIWTGR